ncbi:Importin beta-3 [Reticulomyxa filosa]|uniref:Importin beta-3 n=1 Tax=Reticulomyxa filosa TaxID=46433 RepID=X6NPK6_RETFI|nr:Importin beta-3 [Reticulomyxa filosa]|eukprot:ETO27307.1 Importin beta-3 [Reticulomyxa filosa]
MHICNIFVGIYQLLEYQGPEGAFVHKAGLYVLCDIYEQLPPAKTCSFLEDTVSKALTILKTDQDLLVRQASFYLFGVIAQRCEEKFSKYICVVLDQCMQCIRSASEVYRKGELSEDAGSVVDCAMSTMGKLIKHTPFKQIPSVNYDQVLSIWLSHLPIQFDMTQSVFCHTLLLQLVDQNEPVVLGKNFENMPHIAKIFAQIIDTNKSSDRLNIAIRQICRKVTFPFPTAFFR